jgi:hypothetical protein
MRYLVKGVCTMVAVRLLGVLDCEKDGVDPPLAV